MAASSNLVRGSKQTNGYFVPLGNCVNATGGGAPVRISQYSGGSGAGGSYLPGTFTGADWATPGNANSAGALLSSLSSVGQGGLLKDMGKTVISSSRTFRKVQLVSAAVTGGPAGFANTNQPFFTGYIELATGPSLPLNGNTVAPVAYLPGLM